MTEWTDPASGDTYMIPERTATQSFTPEGQVISDNNIAAQQNMSGLAADQSGRLRDVMSSNFSLNGLGRAPSMPSNLRAEIEGAGGIKSLGDRIDPRTQQGHIAGAGGIKTLGDRADPNVNGGYIKGAGQITKTYGTDFSEDRQRVENALMSRMNPGLQQDRAALEDRLASQGIGIGSDAYSAAMGDFGQQASDARMAAILAGGQEQSRLTGLEANRAAFENSAQAQKFGQNATRTQVRNDAQQANYGNLLAKFGFNNAAQQQQFGQNEARLDARNAAQQGNFQNAIAKTGFNNQVQQQQFGQNMQQAAFRNNAAMDKFNVNNQIRDRAVQEALLERNQPINEIGALMGTGQVTQPNFMNLQGPQAATTDYAGLVNANYGQQMQGYQAGQQAWGGLLGGLGMAIPGMF